MLHTRLCDVLGVESPILSPSVGGSLELAAAISEAGGFGIIGASAIPPSVLRQNIQRIRQLTQKPFGVGFLAQIYQDEHITVCIEEKVPAISFCWDNLSFVEKIHEAGIKVIDQVETFEDAARAASVGVDVIIAKGSKPVSGQANVDIPMDAFVPPVVDMVPSVPIVAVISTNDARAVVAALALGANGTVLEKNSLDSPETVVHELVEGASKIITQGLNGLVSDVPPGSSTTGKG